MDVAREKELLRAHMQGQLAGLPARQRAGEQDLVAAFVQASREWRRAATVLLYRSTKLELSTVALANAAWRDGKRVAMPRVAGGALDLHVVDGWSQLRRGAHGVHEPPAAAAPVAPADVDVALVPGLAFDDEGGRLGRGGGHFDRLLPRLGLSWGLCFDLQRVGRVPREPHDHPVHRVVSARTAAT